jgi:hypothetical protein
MTASSHDQPPITPPGGAARVRTLDDRRLTTPALAAPTLSPLPEVPPAPPTGAREWLGQRIAVGDDFTPGSQHIGWLAAQRAITACERAQLAADLQHHETAHAYLQVADQYRQIAHVCAERAGLTAPKGPDDPQEHP